MATETKTVDEVVTTESGPTPTEAPAPQEPVVVVEPSRESKLAEIREQMRKNISDLNTNLVENDAYWTRLLTGEDIPMDYATQPGKVFQTVRDRLFETVIDRLATRRVTKAEQNQFILRNHQEYEMAAKYLAAMGVTTTVHDGYPYGKLPEAAEAIVREKIASEFLKGNPDEMLPVEEIRLNIVITEGEVSPIAQARRASGGTRTNAANSTPGAETGSRHDKVTDLKTGKSTLPGYECIWDGYAEDQHKMLVKVTEMYKERWEAGGGTVGKVPTKFFGGTAAGAQLLNLAKEAGLVKLDIAGLSFLRRWASMQIHNGAPRYTRQLPNSSDVVPITSETWATGKRA